MNLSAIITAHAEGELIKASVESCYQSIDRLLEAHSGVEVEVLISLDRPDAVTAEVVESLQQDYDLQLHLMDFGDQGLVRNAMVQACSGEYVAFLDGDDLWSENWLSNAYAAAKDSGFKEVVYPEFNWFFEGSENILVQIDHRSKAYDIEAIRSVNLWDALCFCPSSVYKEVPFSTRKIKQGYAYEDWVWNRKVLEKQIGHRIAKDTIIFKRRRVGSQSEKASKRGVMAFPSPISYYSFYE